MSISSAKILIISILVLCIGMLAAVDIVPKPVSNENKLNEQDVLAEYNGGQILRKDIQDKISKLPPNYQGRFQTIDGQIQVLDILATEEVFFLKAKALGIDKQEDVLEKLKQVEKRFYLQEYYKRNVTDKVNLTDSDKEAYYNQNLSLFYMNPNITIEYIQTAGESEANEALKKLQSGTAFDVVSDEYNQNTYAKGLKGKIKNIRLNGNIPGLGNDPGLEDLIRKNEQYLNIFFGPIKTETGWHLMRIVEWIPGRQKELLEVMPEIDQRLRPAKEKEMLDALRISLNKKFNVVIDSTLAKSIDLKAKKNNDAMLDKMVVTSTEPTLQLSVSQLLAAFDKISPQEQIFYIKGDGAIQLIDQELIQNLLYLEAKAQKYEQYFDTNQDYITLKRNTILRRAFEKLVLETIEVSPEEISARYEKDLETYSMPAHRSIQALIFKDQKTANKAWKKFRTAHKKGKEADITKIINKYATNSDKSIYENQYQNGIVTGLGTDQDFSKRIWDNPVGYLSPVFTTAKGEIVFFRTLSETPKSYKEKLEVEPRIYGLIKQEKEKARQDEVTGQLNVEFSMKKYPERIKLTLTAEELFTHADEAARNRNYKDAIIFYDQITQTYANGVDDYKADFMKAFLVAEEMKDIELAKQLFGNFLKKYPEGDLHESARFMIESLNGNVQMFDDQE